jgi:hypothetical protein
MLNVFFYLSSLLEFESKRYFWLRAIDSHVSKGPSFK